MLPGSSLKLVAPVTTHCKTEVCPLVIATGEAVNLEITGLPGRGVGVGLGVGVGFGVGVGVGVGDGELVVVNVRSLDIDGLPTSSFDFTL
jgi:hypothetical protein